MQFTHLNSNKLLLTVTYSRQNLQSLHLPLCMPSARLSVTLELVINLTLSINFILYVTVFPFSFSFLVSAENVMSFSVLLETALQILLPTVMMN